VLRRSSIFTSPLKVEESISAVTHPPQQVMPVPCGTPGNSSARLSCKQVQAASPGGTAAPRIYRPRRLAHEPILGRLCGRGCHGDRSVRANVT
jgi:hypothetical protein